jgi:hypothetical protein
MRSLLLVIGPALFLGCGSEADLTAQTAGAELSDDSLFAKPSVHFLSPLSGSSVSNPVVFRIAASQVTEVEIFADETYSLGPAWNPKQRDTLMYRFHGTGKPRSLRVVGRKNGVEVVSENLTLTVKADTCEDRFFAYTFDANNPIANDTVTLTAFREEALVAIKDAVAGLKSRGAKVTLGGMMSLLLYEGGFSAGFHNTLCAQNSYDPSSSGCDRDPEALYSYQFGIGGIHTSNFHACKDTGYTSLMRNRFLELAAAAGFSTSSRLMTSALKRRFNQVCPGETPTAVDYYILAAHDTFQIPRNNLGSYLAALGKFPFFSPKVSIPLTFEELELSGQQLSSDGAAIKAFGGSNATYGNAEVQQAILRLYADFKADNC